MIAAMKGFVTAALTRTASDRTRLALVVAFAALTALAGMFSLPPLDRDEARFAQATAQMLETGDFITIRFQEDERNKKPAGIYWLQAASVSVFSTVEAREIWAYRIPSLIGVTLAAAFTFLAGARLYGGGVGFIAALLLASAPVVAAEGAIAKTDGVLLALICLAQLAFLIVYGRAQEQKPGGRAVWLFWIAHGAAALVKGPIAAMVSFATGAGLAAARPRLTWLARLKPVAGILILILMIGPWLYAVTQATEGRFLAEAVGRDMFGKVGNAQEGHSGPPGYHAALVWLLFWPAAALILPGLAQAIRERSDWRARFLLAWLIPAWIIFEIAGTKLPHYVLPLYPALAIIAARAATTIAAPTRLARAGAVLYGAIGLGAAALIALPPLWLSKAAMSPLCFTAAALFAAASVLIASLFWRGRAREGAISAAILSSLFAWTMLAGVLPGLSELAISPRLSAALESARIHPVHDGATPVALAGFNEPSAAFLLGTQTALTSPQDAAARLLSGAAGAAVVEARMAAAFHAALNGADVSALAVIDGLNYSNGKTVSLTVYVRAP